MVNTERCRLVSRLVVVSLSLVGCDDSSKRQDYSQKKPPLIELEQAFSARKQEARWSAAILVGERIQKLYPNSDAAKKVAAELPAVIGKSKIEEEQQKKIAAAEAAKMEVKRKAERAKIVAQQKAALAALRRERDEVKNLTFYSAKELPINSPGNYWALYIGVPPSGQPYLRFKWMYSARDWLFIRGMTLNIDGTPMPPATIGSLVVKRDHSGGRIWEWHDESIGDKDIAFFQRLIASKKTIIRYEGSRYHADRVLSDTEKKAFKRVLDAYAILKSR
jgi:hypothetical protein